MTEQSNINYTPVKSFFLRWGVVQWCSNQLLNVPGLLLLMYNDAEVCHKLEKDVIHTDL